MFGMIHQRLKSGVVLRMGGGVADLPDLASVPVESSDMGVAVIILVVLFRCFPKREREVFEQNIARKHVLRRQGTRALNEARRVGKP